MDPLNVAFVASLPRWGGGEKWFLEAAAALAARGHRVLVVGQPDGELVRRAAGCGLHAVGVDMHGIADPRTLWTLGRLLRREGVRIAVTNQAREIRLVGLSQLGRRGFRLVARRGSPDPVKDVWHFRWVYRRLVDRLILNCAALGPRVLADASWFDPTRVRILHNGVDPEALNRAAEPGRVAAELGLAPGAQVVVMVGEVGPRKDQETFLRALARLDDPTLTTLVVGDGPEPEVRRLRGLTAALGLDDRVRWLGFRRDVPSVIALADLLVLPSREEGFPNTLLEAMALGVPVVATPVDGVPELIDDGVHGRLVPPGDPAALADAVRGLLDDPALRRALATAAADRVRREFAQDVVMERFEGMLRELD
jgi:glycosyltransferase involved in cell wall biosynthesis